jgi:MFS family permease
MKQYLSLLLDKKFGLLWLGATISILGDSLTWIALTWLIYDLTGSAKDIGLLVVVYTAPVIVGGPLAGYLLDRFDRRKILLADNLIRGAVMAGIPILHWLGQLQTWHLYAAAGVYGLFKMISLAGIPTVFPSILPEEKLTTANAMETISFGVGGVLGPALGGVLIGLIGGANTIALDALSYFIFAACLLFLPPLLASHQDAKAPAQAHDIRHALTFIRSVPAIWFITIMFMCANVGLGMLSVFLPIYARETLHGDATTFGNLVSAATAGELIGAFLVGMLVWKWTLGRSIASAQIATGASFLGLVALPGFAASAVFLGIAHFFSAPLTIWAQTIRLRLIPAHLRGRVISLLRTLMQAAPPLGGLLGSMLLTNYGVRSTIFALALIVVIPGIIGIVHPALAHENTVAAIET